MGQVKFAQELINLFDEEWKCTAKVVQKDMDFMFKKNPTNIVGIENSLYLNINCGDWISLPETYYNTDVTNNADFVNKFNNLCQMVIDKGFKSDAKSDNFLKEFIDEQHGSGVSSLFWLFYQMEANKDIKNIVIDNIDGFLHPVSMQQLGRVFKELEGYKVIFLMNQDVLFTTWIFEIEDLYVLHGDIIANIQRCTDRELRTAHNMQNLLRAGEFETIID